MTNAVVINNSSGIYTPDGGATLNLRAGNNDAVSLTSTVITLNGSLAGSGVDELLNLAIASSSVAPGSFTVGVDSGASGFAEGDVVPVTPTYRVQWARLQLITTDRATLASTSRLRVSDALDNSSIDTAELANRVAYAPDSFTVATGAVRNQWAHAPLKYRRRATLQGTGRLRVTDALDNAAAINSRVSYSPGSFTVLTETFKSSVRHVKLTSTQRATLQGTATLRID